MSYVSVTIYNGSSSEVRIELPTSASSYTNTFMSGNSRQDFSLYVGEWIKVNGNNFKQVSSSDDRQTIQVG